MHTIHWRYNCNKLLLLGALYDSFDMLGLKVLSADSEAGAIRVTDRTHGVYAIRLLAHDAHQIDVYIAMVLHRARDDMISAQMGRKVYETTERIIREASATNLI